MSIAHMLAVCEADEVRGWLAISSTLYHPLTHALTEVAWSYLPAWLVTWLVRAWLVTEAAMRTEAFWFTAVWTALAGRVRSGMRFLRIVRMRFRRPAMNDEDPENIFPE